MARRGALLLLLAAAPAAAHEALDVQHVRLEARLDPEGRGLQATATLTLRQPGGGEAVELDAVGLDVRRVRDAAGRELAFEVGPRNLRVSPPAAAAAGRELTLAIEYSARPRRGLFFVAPTPQRKVAAQAWTSFWPEEARFVLPCHDDLADKLTSEILLTVPASWRVMANGVLAGTRETGAGRVWHYRLERPHSIYLMAFVAGDYEQVEAQGGSVPIAYLVYRGRGEDARRTFAATPEMLAFFSERTGQPYPWPKYALSLAADFVHGAMENVSAVTLSDHHLLDARARGDSSADGVLAHELAHQWWGDLLTPRTWNDLWLSEGLATFFADAWVEERSGAEAAAWLRLEHAEACRALPEAARRRAVAPEGRVEPWLVLDANVYARAALVLAQLRQLLGEQAFWSGLRAFLGEFAEASATTADLELSLSRSAGRDLRWFFDQWLRREELPDLDARWRYDAQGQRVVVLVRQPQAPFALALDVVLLDAAGERRERLFVERAEQEFSLPATRRPVSLVFDSGVQFPGELRVDKATPERAVDLARGPTPADRALAARALGRAQAVEYIPALRDSLHGDPFWGVRAWAADALARFEHPDAREALRGGLRDPDPRVRAACVGAVAAEGSATGGVLLEIASRDDSDLVIGATLRGLGQARAAGAWEALLTALGRDSAGERLRMAAVDGLAALGDSRGLPLLLEQTAPGRDARLRSAAIAALGRLGRGQAVATSRLLRLLVDEHPGVRSAAARALAETGDRSARDGLQSALRAESHPLCRRDLEAALEGLKAAR